MKVILCLNIVICLLLLTTIPIYGQADATSRQNVNLEKKVSSIQAIIDKLDENLDKALNEQKEILEDLQVLKVRISRRRGRRAGG